MVGCGLGAESPLQVIRVVGSGALRGGVLGGGGTALVFGLLQVSVKDLFLTLRAGHQDTAAGELGHDPSQSLSRDGNAGGVRSHRGWYWKRSA